MNDELRNSLWIDVEDAFPVFGDDSKASIFGFANPDAPMIAVSRSADYVRLIPVYFIAAEAGDLNQIQMDTFEGTHGIAPLTHQVGATRLGRFLMVPAMFHLYDLQEFCDSMDAYLGTRKETHHVHFEYCYVHIVHRGHRYDARWNSTDLLVEVFSSPLDGGPEILVRKMHPLKES